eukprot:1610860-Ditylum_brightwellii.AAC.1
MILSGDASSSFIRFRADMTEVVESDMPSSISPFISSFSLSLWSGRLGGESISSTTPILPPPPPPPPLPRNECPSTLFNVFLPDAKVGESTGEVCGSEVSTLNMTALKDEQQLALARMESRGEEGRQHFSTSGVDLGGS